MSNMAEYFLENIYEWCFTLVGTGSNPVCSNVCDILDAFQNTTRVVKGNANFNFVVKMIYSFGLDRRLGQQKST